MKPKFMLFMLVAVLAAVLLSGCSGQGLNNSWPGLASDGEIAYLASGQYLYAIRLNDGKEIWRYPAKSSNSLQFIAQPVIAPDGTIVVGSAGSDHRLVGLDPASLSGDTVKTPAEKWTFTEAKSSWIAGTLILDNKVFAPNSDGVLYVLDLQDGFSSKPALQKIDLGGALWAQPSTDGNLVYVSSVDHFLYAIDPVTYEFAWPAIDLGGAAPGTPLVGPNGDLYIGSFASEVVKVDPATGKDTLLTSTQGWVWGGPVTDGQNIYFGDLEGNLFAVDAASGNQSWSIQPDGPVVGSPLLTNDVIVFATESGSVYAVDTDGKIVWQREVGGQIYTSPVTGVDRIIVAPLQAEFALAVLDTSGNQVWTFIPEK
ncbi:MAG: PQQ-like beta-propeller repeat protein [Anaerolineales bacterium]|nr:PQQ-like beta-propeller repeat protein [Anaerolineales bacterium]